MRREGGGQSKHEKKNDKHGKKNDMLSQENSNPRHPRQQGNLFAVDFRPDDCAEAKLSSRFKLRDDRDSCLPITWLGGVRMAGSICEIDRPPVYRNVKYLPTGGRVNIIYKILGP